jgi:hypothetical protein
MGEAFERDEIAVVHQLPDGISEMNDLGQSVSYRTTETSPRSTTLHRSTRKRGGIDRCRPRPPTLSTVYCLLF